MKNPYSSRGPLHDARMFWGRAFELSEIENFVNGNQSISIIGPRKIGKTSLMLHLMRVETMKRPGDGKANLFVYINCQMLCTRSKGEIIAQFCTEIAAALQTQGLEADPSFKVVVSKPTWAAFEIALRKLNQRGLKLVLMLDEFERFTMNPHVDISFYNAFRSAAGRLQLVFITASELPLIELTYNDSSPKILSSPFFNIFAQLYVGLLPENEAYDLIRRPMEAAGFLIDPHLENFLYQLAGGHPFAVQVACFHAWDNPEDLYEIGARSRRDLENLYQYYWKNLSQAERDILDRPDEAALNKTDNTALNTILRDLKRKCLLVQRGVTYVYPSISWAEFVSAHRYDPFEMSRI